MSRPFRTPPTFLSFLRFLWASCPHSQAYQNTKLFKYTEMQLEDYKMSLANVNSNYNTPDFGSPYYEIGDVYYRIILSN